METRAKTDALLGLLERRLVEISERQHALAVEKARLMEQMTPLRLGVGSPELALAQLRSKGIALRGVAAAWASSPCFTERLLTSVVPLRRTVTIGSPTRSETA